jgi:uncharacterized protein YndB with AHSA1/START domain
MPDAAVKSRAIEMEVTVDAPVEAVWKALSEGDEMQRWFPPEARIEPGVGGRILVSWGPGMEGEGMIERWEPNRRIAWVQGGMPVRVVVDFELEGRGGTTVVRLVHSGFGADSDWDEMYDSTRAGWTYFLFNLAFYLARHRGTVRRLIFSRRKTSRPVAEVWRALLGKEGLNVSSVTAGEKCTLAVGDSGRMQGRVEIVRAPHNFAGVIESLNDGLIFVEMEPGSPSWHCGVWISLYGVPEERARALQSGLDVLMKEILPGEA